MKNKHYPTVRVSPDEDFTKDNRASCKIGIWEILPTDHSPKRFLERMVNNKDVDITASDWKNFFQRIIRLIVSYRRTVYINGKPQKIGFKYESGWKTKDGDEILMSSKTLNQSILFTLSPKNKIRVITILPNGSHEESWKKPKTVTVPMFESINFHNEGNNNFLLNIFGITEKTIVLEVD